MFERSPYARLMRLHQPVGIWLLLWPCLWAVALEDGLNLPLMFAFAAGAIVMRSAGCIINDLWDRKLDAQVERTRDRPLASGELQPAQALVLLALLLLVALGIAFFLGDRVVLWSAAALPLVAAYPLMKRITFWPQLFLGFTFNWGALLGSVAVHGEVTPAAGWLYAGGIFWTLGYDTIYAHQDKVDDARIGIKSTALRLHRHTRMWVGIFYAVSFLCFLMAGFSSKAHGLYFILLVGMAQHFTWQVMRLETDKPAVCRRLFLSNASAGGWLFLACLLANAGTL